MRYIVVFKSGRELFISESEYNLFFETLVGTSSQDIPEKWFQCDDKTTIHLVEVEMIKPETALDQPAGIVKRPSPQTLKVEQAKEHNRTIADPNKILSNIKKREAENEPE